MRIRGTKSEFWKSRRIAAVSTDVVFDGAFPTGAKPYVNLPLSGSKHEFVYLLLSSIGRPVYVGRSWRPADRFSQHKRKPWWPEVSHLTLIRVDGISRIDSEAKTAFVERVLIEELAPSGNVAFGHRKLVPGGTY
jgi:hypothetical protein